MLWIDVVKQSQNIIKQQQQQKNQIKTNKQTNQKTWKKILTKSSNKCFIYFVWTSVVQLCFHQEKLFS